MAIHLHTKYASQIAKVYTHNSLVEGHTNTTWSFSGLHSLIVPSVVTQPLVDYTRSGVSRYGNPADLQDTVQELTMTQDKSFAIVIDKGDNSEQQMMKRAGEVLRQEIAEQVVPMIDRYALKRFTELAGTHVALATPDKDNIVGFLLDAETALNDAFVPYDGRWCYIRNDLIKHIRLSTEFTGCDSIRNDMVVKGMIGRIGTLNLIGVPAGYLPDNAYFLITHKDSVILAQKMRDGKIHQDPPGISGHLLEGRYNFDAFVLAAKCTGVYAGVTEASVLANVTISLGETVTLTGPDGATVLYTTDGSDPRYSQSAQVYSAPFAQPEAGTVVKAAAQKEGMYHSAVAAETVA